MMINNNFNDKISSLCNLNMGIVAITRVQWPILSCYLPNTLTVFFFIRVFYIGFVANWTIIYSICTK